MASPTQQEVVVLNVGREPSFQALRHQLLVEAGYTVFSVTTVAEADAAIKDKHPQVLVVGAWVPRADRDQVVKMVKVRNPQATVIFYYDQNIDGTEQADAILNFRGDHSDLVRTLQHLLSRTNKQSFKHMAVLVTSICSPWLSHCF
jgi:DNA-binding NtrC family response regulator